MTNAPPLPDEPQWFDRCDVCGWPLAESVDKGCVPDNCSMRPRPPEMADYEVRQYARQLHAIATTLRAQLERPMRESAIIEGLERQLAEARGEVERLKDSHKRVALLLIENDKRGIEKWASGTHLNIEQGNATVDVVPLADAVQRADACERDAKRWAYVKEMCYSQEMNERDYVGLMLPEDGHAKSTSEMFERLIDAALGAPT